MKTALTIGGSDPTGGAGIQVDVKTFQSLGVYGLSIPAALTAQNTRGVTDVYSIPPEFLTKQLDNLLTDIRPDALKTGMLWNEEIISIISEIIRKYSLRNIVVDPVTVSSTGVPLLREGTADILKTHLFPLAKVVTPNIYETLLFTGINIQNEADMKLAASRLKEFGPETVIITGGHFQHKATDMLFDGNDFLFFQREKLEGEYHGTGCVFSSAVAASLALGYGVKEAAVNANEFVWKKIKNALTLGKGMKILNV
ncbi:MAG: bifunctional hydroxymethylpyrimidine kinase/phosphomethylpyrimidine kinase [Nitrospiraceae bacterium]|nr:MAG: bifunctional hydroxymethylpyrimidine kinase/phosphomethylpyrimidine kinase [Nitrospiraceae bacterium]